MATDLIRYDLQVQDALRGVVRKVLADTARDGLPGEHHFYITFRTHGPGVKLSQRLRDQYPEEMTIILQYQFWDLHVDETGFEVGLHFKNVPERLYVPYDAISGFYDPSVQFGLKFEAQTEEDDEEIDADDDGDIIELGPVANPPRPNPPFSNPPLPMTRETEKPRGSGSEPRLASVQDKPTKFPEKAQENFKENSKEKSKEKSREKSAVKAESNKTETNAEDAAKVVSIDSFRKKP
jgi:hypothetical protein